MNIFKSHITAMGAYTPPLEGRDPHEHLLLDFNERTLPVSDHIKQALIDHINSDKLHIYPSYGDITNKIANYANVKADQIMITNGSDQGIDIITRATCSENDEIIIPKPTFAMYGQSADIENLTIIAPHFTKENGFPVQEVLQAVSDKTRLIIIANPNNPCGTKINREDILTIATSYPKIALLIDECYFEYSQTTVADMVLEHPNLLITRTFSKTWGLPSVRLGYIISHPDNIHTLLKVRGPYDVNQFASIAIGAALDYPEYTRAYVKEVMEESKPLFEQFLSQQGISFWKSAANFLWIFPDNPNKLEKYLRHHKVYVRPKKDNHGRIGLRITIGNTAQTQKLIGHIKDAELKK